VANHSHAAFDARSNPSRPAKVHALGYEYVLSPVLIGVGILLVTALLINNLSPNENRHYPLSWW
jgi:CBS-domain-containing membrane protein